MDIAAHGVNIAINGKECRMMKTARDLLDEDREKNGDRCLVLFIFMDVSGAGLAVVVGSYEIEFVNVHLIIR